MHFMIEMACRKSGGVASLQAWSQGGQLAGHKANVPKVKASKQGGQLPADLINRLAETSAVLSDLDRQTDTLRSEGKADRVGRRGSSVQL
jgi:hypothetical protein